MPLHSRHSLSLSLSLPKIFSHKFILVGIFIGWVSRPSIIWYIHCFNNNNGIPFSIWLPSPLTSMLSPAASLVTVYLWNCDWQKVSKNLIRRFILNPRSHVYLRMNLINTQMYTILATMLWKCMKIELLRHCHR